MRDAAVGGLLGSTPIICGGFDHREVDQDSCISYNQSQWIKTHTMTTKRYSSGSVQLNATTLWIVGGGKQVETGENMWETFTLDSSEFVGLDSTVGNPGPLLPYPLAYSCVVKYSKDEVFVIGGGQLRLGMGRVGKCSSHKSTVLFSGKSDRVIWGIVFGSIKSKLKISQNPGQKVTVKMF